MFCFLLRLQIVGFSSMSELRMQCVFLGGHLLLLCVGGGFTRGLLLSVDNVVSAGVLTLVSSEGKSYTECLQVGYSSAGG